MADYCETGQALKGRFWTQTLVCSIFMGLSDGSGSFRDRMVALKQRAGQALTESAEQMMIHVRDCTQGCLVAFLDDMTKVMQAIVGLVALASNIGPEELLDTLETILTMDDLEKALQALSDLALGAQALRAVCEQRKT